MGKIDLPEEPKPTKPLIPEKKDDAIADTFPNEDKAVELVKKEQGEEEGEIDFDRAEKLLTYSRFLDIKENKENLGYLSKVIKMLNDRGVVTQKKKILAIKEIQYKIGGEPSIKRVYEYLRLEDQVKNLVEKLKFV